MSPRTQTSFLRPLAVIAILILGAYWAGARWGARQPINVGAVPNEPSASTVKDAKFAERDAALSTDEALNVRIYRQSSFAVANILTKATEYDFWMDPVPVEGAGSGFVIDAKGYILTNFHVVQGAQTIEVVLGDQSRHSAKFIGADQRNDVALIKIDPANKPLGAAIGRFGRVASRTESSCDWQSFRVSEHAHNRSGQRAWAHRANGRKHADR